jgi:hypothetical protein
MHILMDAALRLVGDADKKRSLRAGSNWSCYLATANADKSFHDWLAAFPDPINLDGQLSLLRIGRKLNCSDATPF